MKRTFKNLLAIASLAIVGIGSFIAASPAQAQTEPVPTCTLYTGSTTWPAPTNFYTCFAADSLRRNTVFTSFANLPHKTGSQTVDKWRDVMQSQGVKFYYFKTRASANAYFNRPSTLLDNNPYAGAPDNVFSSSSSRCGQTGYTTGRDLLGNNIQTIAVAIYDECTLKTKQLVPNPQVGKTATHEAAHAYDFALWSKHATNRNHRLSEFGFQELLTHDLAKLTPSNPAPAPASSDWPRMTTAQKNAWLCANFSSGTSGSMPSSELEQDFSTVTTASSVCVGGTPVAPYLWTGSGTGTGGKTPSQIAAEKIPYFETSLDAWAEGFAIRQTGIADGQGPDFLRLTDRILGSGNTIPSRNFNCTRLFADRYILNGQPPTGPEFTAAGCPVPAGALF